MVDFQTLTLFSLTLLTAAMFIFYYLLVKKARWTPHVARRISQTPLEHSTSISSTKTENPTLNLIQIPSQAPIQIKASDEIPVKNQSQNPGQTRVQADSQIPLRAPFENRLDLPTNAPILRGEAAAEALKEFAKELEKKEATSVEKTRDASLIKLARVLIDVIQGDKHPDTIKTPDQNKSEAEHKRKTLTKPSRKHDHSHEHTLSRKKKRTKVRQLSRTKKANRKTKNKETRVKSRDHGRPTEKHSKHAHTLPNQF